MVKTFSLETSNTQRLTTVGAVIALHGAVLWVALNFVHQPEITPPKPEPVMMASIISSQPQPPKPIEPPKPQPVVNKPIAPTPPPVATTQVAAPAEHKVVEPVVTPKPIPQIETPPAPPAPVVVAPTPAPPPPPAPVKRPPPPEPETVTEAQFDADYLNNPAPEYPRKAQMLQQQGQVKLRVLVSPEGKAMDVQLFKTSSFSALDNAAIKAVREWRFVPAKRGKEAIQDWVIVPVSFKL